MAKFENIFDNRGKKIAEVHHDTGRDNYFTPTGSFLGHTDKNGTRDSIGRPVADRPFGGLLIKNGKK